LKIKFNDNYGTKETVYFNPSFSFFKDGSVIINETDIYIKGKKYEMPLFAGASDIVWADIGNLRYNTSEVNNASNAFKILWTNNSTVNLVRYKEIIIADSWFKRIIRELHEIS
jgi:hypothetical protein